MRWDDVIGDVWASHVVGRDGRKYVENQMTRGTCDLDKRRAKGGALFWGGMRRGLETRRSRSTIVYVDAEIPRRGGVS